VRVFASALAESPGGYSTLLQAHADLEAPPAVVLVGGDEAEASRWQRALETRYRPAARIFNVAGVPSLPPALAKGATPAGGAVAWVCRGMTCLPPMTSLAAVEHELAGELPVGVSP